MHVAPTENFLHDLEVQKSTFFNTHRQNSEYSTRQKLSFPWFENFFFKKFLMTTEHENTFLEMIFIFWKIKNAFEKAYEHFYTFWTSRHVQTDVFLR